MSEEASTSDGSISRLGLVLSLLFGIAIFAVGVWLSFGVILSAALAIGGSAVLAYVVWPRLLRGHS